jgi:RHS repeat-associated protein
LFFRLPPYPLSRSEYAWLVASAPVKNPSVTREGTIPQEVNHYTMEFKSLNISDIQLTKSIDIDPSSGRAALGVNIPLPQGRAGFSPSFSLTYSSTPKNSLFGLGWGLSGISAFSLDTKKGLPKYDGSDNYTFNADALVPSKELSGATWKQRMDETTDHWIFYYRPKFETFFSRCEQWMHKTTRDIHWRTRSKDDVVSVYGMDASGDSRILDPADPRKVFQWLMEAQYDQKGNAIIFKYKKEDGAFVDPLLPYETARKKKFTSQGYAQKYPDRILYGNTKPLVPAAAMPAGNKWMFEVIFDYGNYTGRPFTDTEPPAATQWPARPDPFSVYFAGFEIRTYRLCKRILVYHHFTELNTPSSLTGIFQCNYQEQAIGTTLQSITYTGIRRDLFTGAYSEKSLPPLLFDYSRPQVGTTLHATVQETNENFMQGFTRNTRMVDLFGEGLPGILTETFDAWYYKSNEGGGHFSKQETVIRKPSQLAGTYTLGDFDQSGNLKLFTLIGRTAGYYEYDRDRAAWSGFRAFEQILQLAGGYKFMDVNGDGMPDLLVETDDKIICYPFKGKEGFGKPYEFSKPEIAAGFAPTIGDIHALDYFLTDMTGDGLPDQVRIRNGRVEYYPNMGNGHFGEVVVMEDPPVIDFEGSFDAGRIRWYDLDGSGASDLIYIGRGEIKYWYNAAGNKFIEGGTITNLPYIDNASAVMVLDLLGKGTPCLVWSNSVNPLQQSPIQYIELTDGVKPGLLNFMDNSMGMQVQLEYDHSSVHYLRDKHSAQAWITRLPFHFTLVDKKIIIDRITGSRLTTRYRYHDGFYNGSERMFVTFGLVDQYDTELFDNASPAGEDYTPPSCLRSWYHSGMFGWDKRREEQFWKGDAQQPMLPAISLEDDLLTANEFERALLSLSRKLIRSELFGASSSGVLEADPYLVSQTGYRVRRVQPSTATQDGGFYAYIAESVQSQYEKQANDPRITHHLNIQLSKYGDIEKELTLSYARRSGAPGIVAGQQRDEAIITIGRFTQVDQLQQYRVSVFYEEKSFEAAQLTHAGQFIAWHDVNTVFDQLANNALPYAAAFPAAAGPQSRLLTWSRTYYWNNTLDAALPLGTIGTKIFSHHEEEACFHNQFITNVYSGKVTPAMLSGAAEGNLENRDGYWWQKGPVNHLRPAADFYALDSIERGTGSTITYNYDAYLLNIASVQDAVGNQLHCETDYQTLTPYRIPDYNGNISEILQDPLGVTIASFQQGTLEGALYGSGRLSAHTIPAGANFNDILNRPGIYLQQATSFAFYDLDNWRTNGQPPYILQLVREDHVHDGNGNVNNTTGVQQQVQYFDGVGRTLQKKRKVEPGGAINKLPDGTIARDAAGDPLEVQVTDRWLVSGHAVYNNKGAVVRQFDAYFSATVAFENEAELQRFGFSSLTTFDVLNRASKVDHPDGSFSETKIFPWEVQVFDQNDTVDRSLYKTLREFLPATDPQKMALVKSLAHRDTPQVLKISPSGREIVDLRANNDGTERKIEKKFNAAGKVIEITDARNLTAFTYTRDMLGRVAFEHSMDAGDRWNFYDYLNNAIHNWNTRGLHQRTYFDALNRMVRIHIDGALGLDQDVSLYLYGDDASIANPAMRNLRGQLVRHNDHAGTVEIEKYSPQGEALVVNRRLRDGFDNEANWNNPGAVALATETYTTRREYDAIGRFTQQSLADNTVRKYRYQQGGGIRQLLLTTANGQFNDFEILRDASYNPQAQRMRTMLGNDTEILYSYDEHNARLLRTRSRRTTGTPRTYQDLNYTFDPVGNLVHCIDNAQEPGGASPHVIEGLAVSAANEFTFDALYQLIEAKGRVHQALLPHDYRFITDTAGSWIKGTRHIALNNGAAIERYTRSYIYDVAGNKVSMHHQGATQNWTTQFRTSAHSNKTMPMHDLNDVPLTGDPDDHFDDHGNCIDLPHVRRIEWNYRNNISRIVLIDRSAAGQPDDAEFYVYGGNGLRVRKVTQRLIDAAAGTVELVEKIYLPGCEIKRVTTGGTEILKRFTSKLSDGKSNIALVHTWQRDDRARETDNIAQSRIHYQLTNHLGSASIELDAQGDVITYEEYFPYGGSSFIAGRSRREIDLKDYRYCGKERDDFTGLYYFGYRYYAHFIGGWLSPDPLGPKDSDNLYLYVHNNPVTLVDPNGLQSSTPQAPPRRRTLHGTPELATAADARRYFEGMVVTRFGRRVRVHVIRITPSTQPGVDWDVEARFTPVRPPARRPQRPPRPDPSRGGGDGDSATGGTGGSDAGSTGTPPAQPPGTGGTGGNQDATGTAGTGGTGGAGNNPQGPAAGADGGTPDSTGSGRQSDTSSGGVHDGASGTQQAQTNDGGGGGNRGDGNSRTGNGPGGGGQDTSGNSNANNPGEQQRPGNDSGNGGQGNRRSSDDEDDNDRQNAGGEDEQTGGQRDGQGNDPRGQEGGQEGGTDDRNQQGTQGGTGQPGDNDGNHGQGGNDSGPSGGNQGGQQGNGGNDEQRGNSDSGSGNAPGQGTGPEEHWLDTAARWAGYLNLEFENGRDGASGGIPGALDMFRLQIPMWLRRVMQAIYVVTTIARALTSGIVRWLEEVVVEKAINGVFRWIRDTFLQGEPIFRHRPSSGAIVTEDEEHGTYLIGAYPPDLQHILRELNYPVTDHVDFDFPVPEGQKFNLLNVSDEEFERWRQRGGFFENVNAPWVDRAVERNNPIIVMSAAEYLYDDQGRITGFGKEIHRLEWVHNYRYDPGTHRMVPGRANELPTLTREGDYNQPPYPVHPAP